MIGQLLFNFMLGIPCGTMWRTSRAITIIWLLVLIGYAVGTGESIQIEEPLTDFFCWLASMVGYMVGYFAREIEVYIFSKGVRDEAE